MFVVAWRIRTSYTSRLVSEEGTSATVGIARACSASLDATAVTGAYRCDAGLGRTEVCRGGGAGTGLCAASDDRSESNTHCDGGGQLSD